MHLPPIEVWPDAALVHRGHHHHPWRQLWSRRRFVRTATGLTAVGTAIGTGLLRPRWLGADSAVPPVPIPGGSPGIAELAGREFHVYAPGPAGAEGFDPPDSEPATITDFSGDVGLAYISGMVRRTNAATGAVRELPYVNNDMRFMTGAYRGVDGQVHEGTFAFI